MKLLDIIKENKENNFYLFRKEIKKYLLQYRVFTDKIEINEKGNVEIEFHFSRNPKTNQFYAILKAYLINKNYPIDFVNLIKGKKNFNVLSLIKGSPNESFWMQKAQFIYQSNSQTLQDVYNDFKEKLKLLLTANMADNYILESYLKQRFINIHRQLLKPIIYDVYESIETTFVLYNPEQKDANVDMIFDLSMDPNTYFIIGDIILDYEGSKYNYHFDDLNELKEIVEIACNFLKINPNSFSF